MPIEKTITHKVTLDKLPWALDMTHAHLGECIKMIVYPRVELDAVPSAKNVITESRSE